MLRSCRPSRTVMLCVGDTGPRSVAFASETAWVPVVAHPSGATAMLWRLSAGPCEVLWCVLAGGRAPAPLCPEHDAARTPSAAAAAANLFMDGPLLLYHGTRSGP